MLIGPYYDLALQTFPLPSSHIVRQYLGVPLNEHCNTKQNNTMKIMHSILIRTTPRFVVSLSNSTGSQ